MSKKNYIGVISLAIILAACSGRPTFKKHNFGAGAAAGATDSSANGGDAAADAEGLNSSAFGLMNFRQLEATYSAATGVKLTAGYSQAVAGRNVAKTVGSEYQLQIGALPRDPNVAAISAAKISGATKIASAYCDVLSVTPALLTAKFPGLDLAKAVPGSSAVLAKTLVDGFYGPENSLQGDRQEDITNVSVAIDELKALKGFTPANVFMSVCTAILASGEFYLY